MPIIFVDRASFAIGSGIVTAELWSGGEALNFAIPIASFRAMIANGQRELDAWDEQSRVIALRPDPPKPPRTGKRR